MFKKNWKKVVALFSLALVAIVGFSIASQILESKKITEKEVNDLLAKNLVIEGEFPNKVRLNDETLTLKYTFDRALEEQVMDLLQKFKTDLAVVTILENGTGRVLAAISYDGQNRKASRIQAFSSIHPAASLFKIVTASALIEDELNGSSLMQYRGRSSTLYKSQLFSSPYSSMPLKRAFAVSHNSIFGRAAIDIVGPETIRKKATDFGFQKKLMEGDLLGTSSIMETHDDFSLAELGSGYNRKTMLSPIHAALLAMPAINNGKMCRPKIIDKVMLEGEEVQLETDLLDEWQALDQQKVTYLKDVMQETVRKGTASRAFRHFGMFKRNTIEIGGKTGSIKNKLLNLNSEWYSGYAKLNDNKDVGITISILNLTGKKWYIRPAHLAKMIIEKYYKHQSDSTRKVVGMINN